VRWCYACHVSSAATLIRRARTDAGLTQTQLAERMATTQSAVARLERAGANPTVATLETALNAAGRRLELMAAKGTGVDETQIVERLRLSPAERLQTFQRSQRNLGRLAARARRVR
jgi:transcriptional regulator with XRE-family HTH domain